MLLKKLTLVNFRPFKGNHSIEFSTDKDKNITLVMAENGAGKTTLAQAFQWVLYGRTDGFKNKSVLNSVVEDEMICNSEQDVIVQLDLEHNNIDYAIVKKQTYRKDLNGIVKPNNSELNIYKKQLDGQSIPIDAINNASTIANILPESLSKYFFFDGERIDAMANEVQEGKPGEFKSAVQNILGLTAFIKAIEHLNPGSSKSVIGNYESKIDVQGNEKRKELNEKIYVSNEKINSNKKRIEEVNEQLSFYKKEIEKAKNDILMYSDTEKLQENLNQLNKDLTGEIKYNNGATFSFMKAFQKQIYSFMSKKLVGDALQELDGTNNIDKGIPYIRDETIKYLIDRKKCLCGCALSDSNSEASKELLELLKYIPPQSLGGAIANFQNEAKRLIKDSKDYYAICENDMSTIRESTKKIEKIKRDISSIDESVLHSTNSKIKDLKSRQMDMERKVDALNIELHDLEVSNSVCESDIQEANAEINRLQLKINRNSLLEKEILYAKEAYNQIKRAYDSEEAKTRNKLEKEINSLFERIYDGGMTIEIDDKYKITTYINELQNSSNLDANTARSYSIIFAFIVGVMNLAKQKVTSKAMEASIVNAELPLVMDAPLSSFDQRRIKNICEVIPDIARQVIIFIKDSDGNIAKNEMKNKIGAEYEVSLLDKKYPVSSKITKVGE